MAKPTGATVFWIHPTMAALQSAHISASRIYSGRTYESEAMHVLPAGVVDYEIVLDGRPIDIQWLKDKVAARAAAGDPRREK